MVISLPRKRNKERGKSNINLLLSLFARIVLALLKRTLDLAELQGVAVADGGWDVGVQAFAVETAEVGAVEIGELVGAADVFDDGVAARNGIGSLHCAKIDLWLYAAQVVIVATYEYAFAGQGDGVAVVEDERAPGRVRVSGRLADRSGLDGWRDLWRRLRLRLRLGRDSRRLHRLGRNINRDRRRFRRLRRGTRGFGLAWNQRDRGLRNDRRLLRGRWHIGLRLRGYRRRG